MRSLKPGYTWDTKLRGFGAYKGPNRTTFVTIRNGSRKKLGLYPYMSLADARAKAVQVLYGVRATTTSISLKDAVDRYKALRQPEMSPGTFREYSRHLERFLSLSGALSDLSQSRVLNHLDTIEGQSDRAHAARAIKTFFNWCVQREIMDWIAERLRSRSLTGA